MRRIEVIFANRHPGRFWSVEELFSSIAGSFPDWVKVTPASAPGSRANPSSLLANLVWFRSLKDCDLIHQTGDIHYTLLGSRRRPAVLTIHDLRFLEEARGMRRWLLRWLWLYLPCKRANRVTVISEFTKKKLVASVALPPERVTVVPNCVSPRFVPMEKPWHAPEPRILQVGTTPNKNLERLARACAGLRVRLWVLGKLNEAQRRLLSELGVGFDEFRDLPQVEVVELYRRCDLVGFVSTYEGFGMPILEGQAVGRPVLTSDLSPMREVAGAGAWLANPFEVGSIRAGLLRLLGDELLRQEIVQEGFKNVAKYSATAVARQYAQIYVDVLGRQ